jgi:hypothetical protein
VECAATLFVCVYVGEGGSIFNCRKYKFESLL